MLKLILIPLFFETGVWTGGWLGYDICHPTDGWLGLTQLNWLALCVSQAVHLVKSAIFPPRIEEDFFREWLKTHARISKHALKMGFHYVTQASLKIAVVYLFQFPKCRYYRYEPPWPASKWIYLMWVTEPCWVLSLVLTFRLSLVAVVIHLPHSLTELTGQSSDTTHLNML